MATSEHSPAIVAAAPPFPSHDIFLSHSGKQKGFAKELEARLCFEGYTVFFDQNYDSLPPAADFPSRIFSAIETCKLALVLISEDLLTSRWPLTELCSFVDRHHSFPTFPILPLFFKLSPADLKNPKNLRKWHIKWKKFQSENKRITAAKCKEVVTKVLPRFNGVERRSESEQGEGSYIDEIIQRIHCIVHPCNIRVHRLGADPDNHVGLERLSQIIRDNFVVLEDPTSRTHSESNLTDGCILGMHGVSGSGKTTLCNFLCRFMSDEFMGKVIHLELPTELSGDDDPRIVKQYAKLLSTICPHARHAIASMDLVELHNRLHQNGARFNHKMFLVFDNISNSNYKCYESMIKAILRSAVLGSRSRVMLVAQTRAVLENLLKEIKHRYRWLIIEIPHLLREEAMEVIRRNCRSSVKEDVIPHLLDKYSFPSSSFINVPFVFEQIGAILHKKEEKVSEGLKELEMFCKMVDKCKQEAIQELVKVNLKLLSKDLQVLLFDIALFIIPTGYSKLSDAIPILCSMHDVIDIEMKIMDLMEHRALSVIWDGELNVHDIYVEYARTYPGNSKLYMDEPPLNISDASTMLPIRIHLNYSAARTIVIRSIGSLPHRHYDEVCPHVDVAPRYQAMEVRLDVEVGSTTGALFVKNSCRYCKCTLGLSGDCSSLVCFRTENVQRMVASSPSACDVDLPKLLRLELKNASTDQDIWMRPSSGDKWMRVTMFLDFMGSQIQNTTQHMRRWLWKPLLPYEQWPAASDDQRMSHFLLCRRMSKLRVLILDNAGIQRLENIGVYYPQLEVLEVLDDAQNVMDVSLGNAPKLKRLIAGEDGRISGRYVDRPSHYYAKLWPRNSRRLTLHLGECPALEHVCVDGSFDQVKVVGLLPSSVRYVALESDRCLKSMPGELVTSSIRTHQLSMLEKLRLSCKVVKSLNFERARLGCNCLPSLTKLFVENCESLTHLSVESSYMPNLVELRVSSCEKLEVIEGVQHLLIQQLAYLTLHSLPQLQLELDILESDVGSCNRITTSARRLDICVRGCPRPQMDWNGQMMIRASESMECMRLEGVGLCRRRRQSSSSYDEDAIKCAKADVGNAPLRSSTGAVVPLDRMTFSEGRFTFLKSILLCRVAHLVEVEGFQHFPNLLHLYLSDLPDLTCVSGMWPPSIEILSSRNCPMLREIPPMKQMLQFRALWCIQCTRLEAVEGSFAEMKSLNSVIFVRCEIMEVFPMEDVMDELRKRMDGYSEITRIGDRRLWVFGSKFANVQVMQTWLRDAEFGSCLFETAIETLMWEHVVKGTPGALDALRDYSTALGKKDIMEDDWRYLQSLFFPSDPRFDRWEPGFTLKEQQQGRWIEYQKAAIEAVGGMPAQHVSAHVQEHYIQTSRVVGSER